LNVTIRGVHVEHWLCCSIDFCKSCHFISPKKWAFALLLFMKSAKNQPVG